MTDRYREIRIVLDRDYRSDDAAGILDAISMVKGVVDINPIPMKGDDWVALTAARGEIRRRIMDVLYADQEGVWK